MSFTCLGTDAPNTVVSPNTFTVTYPEVVAPGEIFTMSVQSGQMRNNTRTINRMTFDYAMPTNAAILGVALAGGQSGLGGVTPSVVRVDRTAKTNNNNNGTVARIWGGVSARFGSSNSTSSASGGINVPANTDFRLPKVDILLRAPAEVGAQVTVGLPGADLAHTGNGTAASTDLQYARASATALAQCSSGSEAAALATTIVGDLPPALLPSSTVFNGGDRTLGPDQPTQFSAEVTAEYGAAAVPQGQVEFRDGDSNELFGVVNPGSDRVAKLDYTFPAIEQGQPDQVRRVVANYLGVTGDVAASSSGAIVVTNTSQPTVFHEVGFGLVAELGVETPADVPVTITARITRPAGTTNPDQAMVQLYRGDTPVGEPVALPAGAQMSWTDTIERQPRTTTERYRAELVAPVTIGYQKWTSAAPQPVAVIVRGSDPSLDPPIIGGDSGSLSMFGSLGNVFGS